MGISDCGKATKLDPLREAGVSVWDKADDPLREEKEVIWRPGGASWPLPASGDAAGDGVRRDEKVVTGSLRCAVFMEPISI